MVNPIRLALERLIFDIYALAEKSEGIAGLHQNGDIAPWSDLLSGSPYSPWLGDGLEEACAALVAPPADMATVPGDEAVEAAAQRIYLAMRFERIETTPPWVDQGNSLAQDAAREAARKILAAQPPAQPAPPAEGEVDNAALVEFIQELARVQHVAHGEGQGPRVDLVVAAEMFCRPAPPAEGEVAKLVEWLQVQAQVAQQPSGRPARGARWRLARAAELLSQHHPEPLPPGIVPVEYWDIDSGARIVSEPAEEGSGGCWVVLNSRHVNPCTEFPTLEAAWKALQVAHALPLPAGEVEA